VNLHDEIWGALPEDRVVDDAAFAWAVDVAIGRSARRGDQPPRVLDLGCGDGLLAGRLEAAGLRVVGVDPSAVALERARSAHPGVEFAQPAADGALLFADADFDAVACVHVLEHVADTQRLMSEARRVLRPRGALAVAVPWHGRVKNLAIALGSFERHHDPLEPVLRFYTPRSLRSLLVDFGFEEMRLRGAGGVPFARETLLAAARRA
jgi:2-polyprenyl-6-hydroxyphenyl methylase/3-demethylubiquinone-9 3-methyltransferase